MSVFKNYDEFYNAIMSKNLELAKKIFVEYPFDLSDIDYFLFRQACYSSNLEIIQWLYYTAEEKIDIRCSDDMPFLMACAGNQFEIVKWLYEVDPSININIKNEICLIHACLHNNIEFVTWLHDKCNKFNYTYLYATFEYLCKRKLYVIPIYLSSKCNDFYLEIEDNNIKSWKIISEYHRKLLDINNYIVSNMNINICEVCYDNKEYYVKYKCTHMYCKDCSLEFKKCPMCFTEIDTLMVNLIKIEK